MRKLIDATNVDAPTPDYLKGRVRDKVGATPGTTINEVLLGDEVQFFQKLVQDAGITENDTPDNETNGFQLVDALISKVKEYTVKREQTTTVVNSTVTVGDTDIFSLQFDNADDFEEIKVSAVINYEDVNTGTDDDLTLKVVVGASTVHTMSITRNQGGFFKRAVPINFVHPNYTAGLFVKIVGSMSSNSTSILGGTLIVEGSKKKY